MSIPFLCNLYPYQLLRTMTDRYLQLKMMWCRKMLSRSDCKITAESLSVFEEALSNDALFLNKFYLANVSTMRAMALLYTVVTQLSIFHLSHLQLAHVTYKLQIRFTRLCTVLPSFFLLSSPYFYFTTCSCFDR